MICRSCPECRKESYSAAAIGQQWLCPYCGENLISEPIQLHTENLNNYNSSLMWFLNKPKSIKQGQYLQGWKDAVL